MTGRGFSQLGAECARRLGRFRHLGLPRHEHIHVRRTRGSGSGSGKLRFGAENAKRFLSYLATLVATPRW